MAKFPVESSDLDGIVDGVNYVLSGPSGLGQNFAGFSTYQVGYLTGNYRTPFTQPTYRQLSVDPINLASSEFVDGRTLKFTFLTPQSSAPFYPGDNVTVEGVSNDWYDYRWTPIGVIECTTTYCLVRTGQEYTPPFQAIGGGGTISLTNNNILDSTDCNARVTVTGTTDKVFISGQLENTFYYTGTGGFTVTVQLNRYRGFNNTDPVNPDFFFEPDGPNFTVAQKVYSYTATTGSTPTIDTIFSTILDQATDYNTDPLTPWPAYYWYIMEVMFESETVQMTSAKFGLRSLSVQVVKQ